MKSYCTVEQVLKVAIVFWDDVWPTFSVPTDIVSHKQNTKTIPKADVEAIIEEASEMVRAQIKPYYDSVVIDNFDPDYPPVIVYLTKTLSAMLMLERYAPVGIQNSEHNKALIDRFKRSMKEYQDIIVNGALTDENGTLVSRTQDVSVLLGRDNDEYKAFDELRELYENGRIY